MKTPNYKIYDHKYKHFLPLSGVFWSYRSVVEEKYEGIELLICTGVTAKCWDEFDEDYKTFEVIEGHRIKGVSRAFKDKNTGEFRTIEGEVEWHEGSLQIVVRGDDGSTYWLKGLYDLEITGHKVFTKKQWGISAQRSIQ